MLGEFGKTSIREQNEAGEATLSEAKALFTVLRGLGSEGRQEALKQALRDFNCPSGTAAAPCP